MEEREENKKRTDEQIKKEFLKRLESNQEEINEIFSLTNSLAEGKFSDSALDFFNEKINLTEYREHNPPPNKYMDFLRAYAPKFPKKFYREIHRLIGLPTDDASLHSHPSVVAKYTNILVYGLFPGDTLRHLQRQNPRVNGVRLYKHHQLLSKEGETLLYKLIDEATDFMKGYNDWPTCYKAFCIKHGIPYQLDVF